MQGLRDAGPESDERLLRSAWHCLVLLRSSNGRFVEHYNHRRLHEALQNVTPVDAYAGRQVAILERRARIKRETLARRKRESHRGMTRETCRECDLLTSPKSPEDFDDVHPSLTSAWVPSQPDGSDRP